MFLSGENLQLLRASMKENNFDAYIIPNSDPHLGEYIPEYWHIVNWLTGFTGSAATVVVTGSFAGLWTDSRYYIQARDQLRNSGCVFMEPPVKGYIDWLKDNLISESKLGIDGRTISVTHLRNIQNSLKIKQIVIETDVDLVSEVWKDRPPLSVSPAFELPVKYCGKDRKIKIEEIREEMVKRSVNYHLLTSVDDIMWMLNIRGRDIKYSPLLTSFALIGEKQVLFFTDENKIPLMMARDFDKLDIVMLPYEDTAGMLSTLSSEETILINPETTSAALFNAITKGTTIREDASIPSRLKAIKNKTEVESLGRAMLKDGVALTKFFHWIETNTGSVPMSELSLTEKINHFRSEQENFLGPSFSTISALNEHGALPHYSATSFTDSVIGSEGILLVDSGGQYLDGTTDITRTIAIGKPDLRQKKDFTLVLKGHISLAMAKFPAGTKGYQLDMIARRALWENGHNYGHGTGHGVGFCLNVHETPPSISPLAGTGSRASIEPGMLISNEPAVYREGEYGIRTENLILCYEDEETEFGKFLKFETLSLCYIDTNLIDKDLLDEREIAWLNSYHTEVFEKLSPLLSTEEKRWLREKTEKI